MMVRPPRKHNVSQTIDEVSLAETQFWLQIMADHALFIHAGLPVDAGELRDETMKFYREFSKLLVCLQKILTQRQFHDFILEVRCVVKEFYNFTRHILIMKLRCNLGGTNYPLLLDHMNREAKYFIAMLDEMKEGSAPLTQLDAPEETVFWLRLMADHAKFIAHWLDPSERALIQTADNFSREFDNFNLQGQDFSSMLHHKLDVPAFGRFLKDVTVSVTQFRDFKAGAEELIKTCQLLGIMPEQVADHVRREADHFLKVLNMMNFNQYSTVNLAEAELQEDKTSEYFCVSSAEALADREPIQAIADNPVNNKPLWDHVLDKEKVGVADSLDDDYYDDDECVENTEKLEGCVDVNSVNEPTSVLEPVEEEPKYFDKEKSGKYKWNVKWPRPLGKGK